MTRRTFRPNPGRTDKPALGKHVEVWADWVPAASAGGVGRRTVAHARRAAVARTGDVLVREAIA